MRERKRLENVLATEADLVRRGDDIHAYFELAHEGEEVSADLRVKLMVCGKSSITLRRKHCCPARMIPGTRL